MDPSSASGGERMSAGNWLISLSAKLLGAGEEGRERWERRLSRAPAGGRRHRQRGNLRVGTAGVTASSGHARAASRRAAGGCGSGAALIEERVP